MATVAVTVPTGRDRGGIIATAQISPVPDEVGRKARIFILGLLYLRFLFVVNLYLEKVSDHFLQPLWHARGKQSPHRSVLSAPPSFRPTTPEGSVNTIFSQRCKILGRCSLINRQSQQPSVLAHSGKTGKQTIEYQASCLPDYIPLIAGPTPDCRTSTSCGTTDAFFVAVI